MTANPTSLAGSQMLHSASSLTCNEYQQTFLHHHSQQPNGAVLPTPNESPSQHYSHHSSPKYQSNRTTPTHNNGQQLSNNQQQQPAVVVGSNKQNRACSNNYSPVYVHNKTTSFINNIPNPRFEFNETIMSSYARQVDRCSELENRSSELQQGIEAYCHSLAAKKAISHAATAHRPKKTVISTENSIDSETSQGDEHNFSELLNLSVCAPSSIINCDISALTGIGEYDTSQNLAELQQSYSIANSVTVSDISSLANLGTPDSPPRATSPTVEIRELLDKIQQLPQQKSPAPDMPTATTTTTSGTTSSSETSAATVQQQQQQTSSSKNNRFFGNKSKSKTLYMPLNTSTHKQSSMKLSPNNAKQSGSSIFGGTTGIFSYAGKTTKGWLSRSAPTTPCGNFVPLFPSQRRNGGPKSHMGSKTKMDDASALLTEYEGSDDEQQHNNANERL